jgi:class 3 adenylate cyclase
MQAEMQGRKLRSAIVWTLVAAALAGGLSFYKRYELRELAKRSNASIQSRHQSVVDLFQSSFFFFYEDQFVPGIKKSLSDNPGLKRIRILSNTGNLLFDTNEIQKSAPSPQPFNEKEILTQLSDTHEDAKIFVSGFQIDLLKPSGQYAVLYTFDATFVRTRIILLFFGSFAILLFSVRSRRRFSHLNRSSLPGLRRHFGLRFKFFLTIVSINILTGAIVFFTLSALQNREQSERIERNSVLFSQFSTDKIITDFSNYFYFYYNDKFIPSIKTIISTNENLIGIRIISRRTDLVLFDSESASTSIAAGAKLADLPKSGLSPDVLAEFKSRDLVVRKLEKGGSSFLKVYHIHRNEAQEALFLVEYLFSFESLYRSIHAIRRQILLDLFPAMGLGLLIALLFAQFLISPIRRLVAALKRVSAGDYDVAVSTQSTDEIGELVTTFNAMAGELKKKTELRKYLSDSTYRQVMEAAETSGSATVKGSRVAATVLFCDIRNFVSHCENLSAEEVTAMLNEYFSMMVDVVYSHGGEVDKFIGDALLAVFYASNELAVVRPQTDTQHPSETSTALQSVYCGLEMRERLKDFNEKRKNQGKQTIEIGIGISHGEIISGPIGSKDRMDFTVIGDVVNLASRIEKLSKLGKHTRIVFSQHVEEKVRGLVQCERISSEPIRGKEESVVVYELVRIEDLQTLISNLESDDPGLRARSLELLGHSHNSEALPYLLRSLDDPEEIVRVAASGAIAKLAQADDSSVLSELLKRMRNETSARVLSSMLKTFGRLCHTDRVLEIASFLEYPDDRIVANAIEALSQVRSPKCADVILPKLSSHNNRVRANAAMALFASGHFQVIETLKPMLLHSDPFMRSSSAFVLGELTLIAHQEKILEEWKSRGQEIKTFLAELQECVPMLVSLLKDSDPMVKRQVIVALGKIKDKSTVLPLIDSIDLVKDKKELIHEVAQALHAIGAHQLVREVLSRLN